MEPEEKRGSCFSLFFGLRFVAYLKPCFPLFLFVLFGLFVFLPFGFLLGRFGFFVLGFWMFWGVVISL